MWYILDYTPPENDMLEITNIFLRHKWVKWLAPNMCGTDKGIQFHMKHQSTYHVFTQPINNIVTIPLKWEGHHVDQTFHHIDKFFVHWLYQNLCKWHPLLQPVVKILSIWCISHLSAAIGSMDITLNIRLVAIWQSTDTPVLELMSALEGFAVKLKSQVL